MQRIVDSLEIEMSKLIVAFWYQLREWRIMGRIEETQDGNEVSRLMEMCPDSIQVQAWGLVRLRELEEDQVLVGCSRNAYATTECRMDVGIA